jgi:hypothetical protein
MRIKSKQPRGASAKLHALVLKQRRRVREMAEKGMDAARIQYFLDYALEGQLMILKALEIICLETTHQSFR